MYFVQIPYKSKELGATGIEIWFLKPIKTLSFIQVSSFLVIKLDRSLMKREEVQK